MIYASAIPLMAGLLLSGCVMHEAKPDSNAKSSIISGYLNENGAQTSGVSSPCQNGNCASASVMPDPESTKTAYEKERDRKLASIVKTSPTPMRVPDTVLRVLVLPYVDDSGALTAQNYKFAKVDDGKWILGEYLVKEGSAVKMLTPLTVNTISDEQRVQQKQPQGQQAQPQPQQIQQQAMMNPMMQNAMNSQKGDE